MTVGTYSPPVQIVVAGNSGFSGTVSLSMSGLPAGAISSPPTPLVIVGSGEQQVSVFIPPAAQTGTFSIRFTASSGKLSHIATLNLMVEPVSGTAALREAPGDVAAGMIEIQGVSAGPFNPTFWQQNTLNWVPDVRTPLFTALTTGPLQNIYAPWAIEQPGGWRMFYGGDDGSDTPNDRVYSVTTQDFLGFQNRGLVIDHGVFVHVNNVNVQQLPDGSMHMICTVAPDPAGLNKPAYFSSPDGITWNGSPQPYQAQFSDIVDIQGYSGYQSGDFNGGNVLLRDNDSWVLYFYDNNNNGQIFRAVGDSPHTVQLTGTALQTGHDPNDVKKFVVAGQPWYLMGLMSNADEVWYSLSNDGVLFPVEQTMFHHQSSQDMGIVSLSFVTSGTQLLGVLYGASTDPDLSINQIYGRWLQKRIVLFDSLGNAYPRLGGYGPDRQWFTVPQTITGTAVFYAEDGTTQLGSNIVTLTPGKSYNLVLN